MHPASGRPAHLKVKGMCSARIPSHAHRAVQPVGHPFRAPYRSPFKGVPKILKLTVTIVNYVFDGQELDAFHVRFSPFALMPRGHKLSLVTRQYRE